MNRQYSWVRAELNLRQELLQCSHPMKRFVLVSILLHCALAALFVLFFRRLPAPPPPQQNKIWLVQRGIAPSSPGKPPKGAIAQGPQRPRAQSRTKLRPQSQLNLGLPPQKHTGSFSSEEGSTQGKGSREQDRETGKGGGVGGGEGQGDGYATANQMDMEKEGKLYPFFEAIWKRVDGKLSYPQDFIDQNLSGQVTVQLEIDRTGVFTKRPPSVQGPEPMLNAFVLMTLLHALAEPLPIPKKHNLKEDRILLVFNMTFKLIQVGQAPEGPEYTHFKNLLAFRRDALAKPIFNDTINRIFTRYVPPIIPIPGGFFIDFPRAYLFVDNLIHPKADEEDLRRQRLEMSKERIERLIQRSAPEPERSS